MTTTDNTINWFEFASSKGSGSGSAGKGSGKGSGKASGKGSGKASGKGSGGQTKDPAWIKGRLTLDADNNDSETDSVNGGFDEGVADQIIELYDGNGKLVGSTTTDANGMYQFDVVQGNYRVKFPEIDGYKYGAKDADPDPTQDSDANPNGYTDLFCAVGTVQANVDAGLQLLVKNTTDAVDDNATTEVSTPIVVDVLANDTDAQGDAQKVTAFDTTSANDGTISIDADGNLVYTPAPGFVGNDTFEYTITDANGATDTATVTICVEDNSPPNSTVAVDDGSTTELDTQVVIDVLANDTDPEGDAQEIAAFDGTSTNGGSIAQDANGNLIYTPAVGFTGTDTFEYTVVDANGATDTGTVTITVENNSKPNTTDAVDDAETTELDTPVTINVLANDVDLEGDEQRISEFDGTSANGGSVVQDADGNLVYTPAPGFTGVDTFQYTVSDTPWAFDTATVTVTVVDNTVPNTTDAVDDASTTELNTPIVIEVLANDTDAEGDTQSVTDFDGISANGGSVVQNANGDLIYTPAPGFTGTDTFEYTVTDANGATDTAAVTVTVEDNSKPNTTDAVDDASTTELDTPIVIEVLANDTDAEGDTQSVTDFDGVSANGGSVVQNANGDLIYTPAPGFTGTDTFEYTVTDANGATDTATVTVTVEDNSKPNTTDAVDDASTTELDTPIVVEVLANDIDAEGDTQSVTDFDGISANGGSVVQNANGDLIYTPAAGFTGTDTFEYTVTDANGATDTATVTVTVEDNSKPNTTDAVDDASTTELDTPIVIEVLANDTDAEGDTQSVSDFDGVSANGGSVVQNADGDLIYTPAAGFTGTDTFEYTVTDANGATDTATVTVTVEDNSKPNTTDAVDDVETTDIDTPVVIDVLGNDIDAEGDGQKIEDFDGTSENGGFVALTREGNLVYIPAAGFTGVDTFNYTVSDDNGATDVATVTITVEDNSVPNTTDAVDDASTTELDTPIVIEVLANDTDAEGDTQSVTDFDGTSANGGSVVQNANGDLIYTPAAGFTGTDTFEYTVTDANGATDTATVTVTVEDNSKPNTTDAVDDASTTELDTPIVIEVLANDTDAEGDTQSVTDFDGASANGGSVVQNANGDLIYTPAAGFTGTDTFEYTVTDVNGATDTATVTVTVEDNSKPNTTDAVDDASTTELDTPVLIDVLANDTDAEGDTQSVTDFDGTSVNGGSIVQNANGDLIYTPAAGFTGTDTFEYTVTDASGATDTATVTVTVEDNSKPNTTDAVDDSTTTNFNSAVDVDVLANDVDAEGDAQTVTGFDTTSANGGTIGQNADGDLTYTPADGFSGTDTFEYTVTDENGATDSATVTVDVDKGPVNSDPDAVDDSGSGLKGDPIVIDVLENDTDPEGDPLKVISNTDGASGSVVPDADGNLVYTPTDPDFVGTDSFTYTISDGNGGIDTATVVVEISGKDDPMIMGTEDNDKRIEGTDGDDLMFGKGGHDCLVISDGDDVLDGGAGYDMVIFSSGASDDYFFEANDDGSVTVKGDTGADLLIDIEGVYFEETDEWFKIEDLVEDTY